MRIPPPEHQRKATSIRLLVVTPSDQDHDTLGSILSTPEWTLHGAQSVSSAMAQLRKHPDISIVLCERDLWPGSWQEMLLELNRLNCPPLLVVASRFADEQLWAEALNLGAYDVLAKPFEPQEVSRTLRLAWARWHSESVRVGAEQQEVRFASGM